MRTWLAALFSLVLTGCASTAPPMSPQTLWRDDAFAPATVRIAREDVFAVDERMRNYLQQDVGPLLRQLGRQRGLVEALYRRNLLQLDYDSRVTRNAVQAFEARSGNCLSLVILTAALARELGLQVHFQTAYVDETWARSGQFVFRSGHVNVTIGRRPLDIGTARVSTDYTVDFLPADELRRLSTREVGEDTVVAMYFNNRSAETLAAGDVDNAYWWARAATRADPSFSSAFNTLGVIYVGHGDLAAAEHAFAHVLAREPASVAAMSNLAYALQLAGRAEEAAQWRQRLAQLEPYPPFHWFELGRAAMSRGDVVTARSMFAREVERMPYYHEFHYWLAVADYRLGDLEAARRHLAAAREQSTNASDQELYAAKLNWLGAQRAH